MTDVLQFFAAPFCMVILMVGIHAYLGQHVLEREVIFVDISLSQVAALGAALALFFTSDEDSALPVMMSLALCVFVALALALFRRLERKISQEVVIGVTYALASGFLVLAMDKLPHGTEHLKEALVGNILFVTWPHVGLVALVYGLVGLVHLVFRRQFWACSRGEDKTLGWDFLFYLLFGVVITFSTKHAGVLVVFSILIVPAALASRLWRAWLLGVACVLIAFAWSYWQDLPAGAAIVAVLTTVFFTVLLGRAVRTAFG